VAGAGRQGRAAVRQGPHPGKGPHLEPHWAIHAVAAPCPGPPAAFARCSALVDHSSEVLTASPFTRPSPKAIYLLTTGAREAAFRNIKTIAECLADELVNAAKGSSNRCVDRR
jgi:hypothetical protein